MSKFCRTCTQTITNEYFYLDGSIFASADVLVKDLLLHCVPEIDVDLVPNAALCRNCISALYIAYHFKAETVENEKLFRNKERIRLKNFDDLTKNTLRGGISTGADSDTNKEAFELELDDIDKLKTEIVYDDIEEASETIEITPEDVIIVGIDDSYCENTASDVQSNEDQENIRTLDSSPSMRNIETNSETELKNSEESFKDQDPDADSQLDCQNSISEEDSQTVDLQKYIEIESVRKTRRNIKRPFKCNECNFQTETKASLVMHRRIHTGEKPFPCTKCTYKATRKAHLVDHMKIHTGERPFRCMQCDKSFITNQMLKKHKLIHTGEKPYRCLQCNFKARHKLTIANHVKRLHIGISMKPQPSICYVCGKCLSCPASLSTHMKIHTGVRSHLCELCGMYFREKGMLKNHMQVHTGEKPFTCTKCNYSATRKAHLQEHLRTHCDQRTLILCMLCDKRYTSKLLLRKHMKEEHISSIEEEKS